MANVKKTNKTLKRLLCGVLSIIAIVVGINVFNYIKYKPLSDALSGESINVSEIKSNYSNANIQNSKAALKVFEKELEKCHKNNDLKKALDIINVLATLDVAFGDSVYDGGDIMEYGDESTTYLNPYISSRPSFTKWIYEQAANKGKQTQFNAYNNFELYDNYFTTTYEIYGYKVSAEKKYISSKIEHMDVYLPALSKWYNLQSKDNTNILSGGVIVD